MLHKFLDNSPLVENEGFIRGLVDLSKGMFLLGEINFLFTNNF